MSPLSDTWSPECPECGLEFKIRAPLDWKEYAKHLERELNGGVSL